LGRWLSEKRLASAMMDLSDGLSADLPRLCAASGVGAHVHAARIPAVRVPSRRGNSGANPLTLALHGGDDYELLFSVPRKKLKDIPRLFHGISITEIGDITKKRALLLIDKAGQGLPLPNRGWDPFQNPR
jgi:thiamine-monophosphate kinase